MNAKPLSKEIYNRAIKLGVTTITLRFYGGSDEGYLDVEVTPWNEDTQIFSDTINDWAWNVYSYSGAGEGHSYGDDIEYDLVNKKVTVSEWYYARQEGDTTKDNLEIMN